MTCGTSEPIPLVAFLTAVLGLYLLNACNVVSSSIQFYWIFFEDELRPSHESNHDRVSLMVQMSKAVGFVEQILYLYAQTICQYDLIETVLLFKAFNGWLTVRTGAASDTTAGGSLGRTRAKKIYRGALGAIVPENLVRFYEYAIGNFISLAYAIAVFRLISCNWFLNLTNSPRYLPTLLTCCLATLLFVIIPRALRVASRARKIRS